MIETGEERVDLELFTLECGYSVYSVTYPKYMVTMGINGKSLQMEIDSGSVVSIVNEVTYKELIQDRPLQPTHMTLRDCNHAEVPLLGIVSVPVEYNGERKTLPLAVSKGNRPYLLSRNWLAKIKLNWNEIVKPDQINCVSSSPRPLESTWSEYCEVLDGGEESTAITPFKALLTVSRKAPETGTIRKSRGPPYALRPNVDAKLVCLEHEKFIHKIDSAS